MHAHRRDGRVVSFLLRRIQRYRASGIGGRGSCRFTPSCSHYAEEALRTRRLPTAALLIVWRLLRCNPFMHRRVADPVARSRRWRLRPNAVPTMFAILAMSGFIVVVTAGVAEAVGVSGGCQAKLNGHDPADLDSNHPLKVHKGDTVGFVGTIPRSALINGSADGVASNTHIDVDFITGIGSISSSDHPGHGAFWAGSQEVDKYLKYTSGLYKVSGVASGTGGWSCTGSAYIWLDDGDPLGKPVGGGALAATLLGLAGAAYASRAPEPLPDDNITPPGGEQRAAENEATSAIRDSGDDFIASLGCLLLILIAVGVAFIGDGWFGASAFAGRLNRPPGRRIRSHGHPIFGFISGVLFGIGLTVLLQQFAVWPLTIMTAIVLPVVLAVICSLRAWLGRSYRVVPRTS